MNQKLFKKSTRVIIPFKEDENDEYIEVKNPKEYTIKKVKERIINRIDGKDDFDNNEILEFLIKELTNVELECSLDELLEREELSFECKSMLYHITDIYHEIQQECLMFIKMDLMAKKSKKIEDEVVIEMGQL